MSLAVSSQELVQKDPRGESKALRQPEEAALSRLTGDSTAPMNLKNVSFRNTGTPASAAHNMKVFNRPSEIQMIVYAITTPLFSLL